MRGEPDPPAERSQPRPGQARAQLVTDRAPLLRYPENDDEPASVPSPRLTERVDALGPASQQLGRALPQRHPSATSVTFGGQPALAGTARQGLSRGLLAVAHRDQGGD